MVLQGVNLEKDDEGEWTRGDYAPLRIWAYEGNLARASAAVQAEQV